MQNQSTTEQLSSYVNLFVTSKHAMAASRYAGIRREYTADDVRRLGGSIQVKHTFAKLGARRLWNLLNTKPFVRTLGALTGKDRKSVV